MNTSVFNRTAAPPQEIIVQDCAANVCLDPRAILNMSLTSIASFWAPQDPMALPVDAYGLADQPAVIVLGAKPKTVFNTHIRLRQPYEGYLTMMSRYGLNDNVELALTQTSVTINTAAAAWTSVPSCGPNVDIVLSGFAVGQRIRPFAYLLHFAVSDDIKYLELQPTDVLLSVAQNLRVEFEVDECHEVTVLGFVRNQGYQFVINSAAFATPAGNTYELPTEPSDCVLPGGGGALAWQIRAFDSTGAQVVTPVITQIYAIPYSEAWANAFMPVLGSYAPGLNLQVTALSSHFPEPNNQAVYGANLT